MKNKTIKRTGAGRPLGSKNKVKITDVLADADKYSVEALQFLLEVMRGQVKGASVTTRQAAAIKVLDLALKNQIALEKTVTDLNETVHLVEDDSPIISLKAVQ